MIKDTISNRKTYEGLKPELKKAFDFLADLDKDDFSVKTIEIDGRNLFVMLQTYETEFFKEHRYESHKNYLDIQFVLDGSEIIRVADISELSLSQEYNPDKDIMFYSGESDGIDVTLKAGDFVVLYPQDGHMPKLAAGTPGTLKKAVVKVKLS